jgi:hypothetical protein
MRWLAVTIALLLACVSLGAWIFLRDRDTAGYVPADRIDAQRDAQVVLDALSGGHCDHGCRVKLLGQPQPRRWLARFDVASRASCYEIDLDTFSSTAQRGLQGISPSACSLNS